VFPAPIMTTIAELGSFIAHEAAAAASATPPSPKGATPAATSKKAPNAT